MSNQKVLPTARRQAAVGQACNIIDGKEVLSEYALSAAILSMPTTMSFDIMGCVLYAVCVSRQPLTGYHSGTECLSNTLHAELRGDIMQAVKPSTHPDGDI